jgi:hypothetical protein
MPFIPRDYELAVQLEAAYNTSPGALAGADFFKHLAGAKLDRVLARYDRENDRDNAQASVITTHKGREHSTWSVACDLIPSNDATTPTAPDIDVFLEAHFGSKHTATAHTVTVAGSVGVTLNIAVGGGAASGLQIGDLIAVDVSAAFGYEVRRVANLVGDVVTVDRAFSTDPAAGRTVKVGTTYRLSSTALKSIYLWQFLNGDNFRHVIGGAVPQNCGVEIDFSSDQPVAKINFDGLGAQKGVGATARPTPVTAGIPLVPSEGKVWIGSALTRIVKYGFKSNNGNTLRMSQSTSLYPTGVKKTDNNSRFRIEQNMDVLLETGTIEGYHDNEAALTAYDVIVQLGVTPGRIVAFNTPKFIPSVPVNEMDEMALSLNGRCYGTSGDDEVYLAFI